MPRTAGRALAVLTLINLLNYLDRYVVAAVIESLKKPDALALDDTQAGLLATGFLVVYMATSPVFGALGDRRARPRLIAIGVFVWSLATALGGLAVGFVTLLLARAVVGVGEAAYATISPAIIADLFPRERRGRVMAIFFAATPIGAALGYVVGGAVDHAAGWRAAFFVAGVPGMLLAFLCARLDDPPRGGNDGGVTEAPPKPMREYFALMRIRTYAMTVFGYAAYTFAVGGMAYWMPSFLHRARGVTLQTATTTFGGIVLATGFLGTFAGGWLGDRLLKKNPNAYLWLSGVATLAAAPFALVTFVATDPAIYWPAAVVAQLFLFASTGPINSVIVNTVPPAERAGASALCIFVIHALGDVPSPFLIGAISDASDLAHAVLIVPVAIAIGGIIWTVAATSRRPPS